VLSNVGISAAAEGAESAIPTAGLVQPEANATILDNDPKLRIGNVRAREGNTGTSRAAFQVTLSHPSPAVTARFATKNGSALAGSDYVARTLTVRFAPGQMTKTVKVAIKGDRKNESNERFFALLSRIHGAIAADTRGKAVIVDND
jgi:endoglucanase